MSEKNLHWPAVHPTDLPLSEAHTVRLIESVGVSNLPTSLKKKTQKNTRTALKTVMAAYYKHDRKLNFRLTRALIG